MPRLNESATKIQKILRGKKARMQTEEKKYINQISKELDENMARTRNEEIERLNELDQILRHDSAITQLQKYVRRNKVIKDIHDNTRQAKSRQATIDRMQNEIRAQGAVNDMIDNAVEHSNARRIQNQFRNHRAQNELIDRSANRIT